MKEKLPHLSRRRLIIPVGLAIAAIATVACSNGVDQNSTQENPYGHPNLSAYSYNLDDFFNKLGEEEERQRRLQPSLSPFKKEQSSSPFSPPISSKNVEDIYRGRENYRGIGTSERSTPNGRLVTTVDLSLGQNTCTAFIYFYQFKREEYVTNTNEVKNHEFPVNASAKNIKIPDCGINQVDALMNQFLSLTP